MQSVQASSVNQMAVSLFDDVHEIRLGLYCLSPSLSRPSLKINHQIFSSVDQTTTNVLSTVLPRLATNQLWIVLPGQYHRIHRLQSSLISSIFNRLIDEQRISKHSTLYLTIEDYPLEETTKKSLIQTIDNWQSEAFFSGHSFSSPLLFTFHSTRPLIHLLCPYDDSNLEKNILRQSLALSTDVDDPSKKNKTTTTSHSPLFLYLLLTIHREKQLKMLHSLTHRRQDEIWVDGPLSDQNKPMWIDRSAVKLRSRSKAMHTKVKHLPPRSPSPRLDDPMETESVVSSHCHLPVLPVFKDHSLLPFRSNSTLPKTKPRPLSPNRVNDDMEFLEKTLETLLVPSSNPSPTHRIDQVSSSMSHDEKNKRLSRIVSPTRFDQLLSHVSPTSSVPNSPLLLPKYPRPSRFTGENSLRKKPTAPLRTTSLAHPSRPSIFQRLFGLRTSSLHTPLTVTLDAQDDLMPMTTSSTASSGRASSSGYESTSQTPIDEGKTRKNQSRLMQLKHRQNELKLELAMTKTSLFMEKKKNADLFENSYPTLIHSPIDSNQIDNEEHEIERDIDYLERRLAAAKSQLHKINSHKHKLNKS